MLITTTELVLERKGSPKLNFDELRISAGEKILLLGASGSGKTTLLSILAGFLKPSQGKVEFEGKDLYALSEHERDNLRGRRMGYVFQTLHLLPSLTLKQNISLPGKLAGSSDDGRADYLLSALGLGDKSGRMPEALSQGEQQRGAIARAILNKPSIIIADEPTSALDDGNAAGVIELLQSQAAENNAALLIATHDNRLLSRFDRIIRLEPGAR